MNLHIYFILARPKQWLKNLLLYFPPFLGGTIALPGELLKGLVPFFAFCCVSSATYLVNDLNDCESDRLHPLKRLRPIPAGLVSRWSAAVMAFALCGVGLALSWNISSRFCFLVLMYFLISVAYSYRLKQIVIVDIFVIALGFVLRLFAGGEAFTTQISDWLFLTVFLLAVFLSVGKRHSERLGLGDAAGLHRRSLDGYPEGFLEGALYLSGASVLVTYSMYSIGRPLLIYTVPLCLFGLLRYLLRVKNGGNGDPTDALLHDGPLLAISILWVSAVALSVYS